uniref:Uncharacterized protein n=1 Tax=Arundo donax TaxID=35708 RepID=A0A0A9Q721_ARUDO
MSNNSSSMSSPKPSISLSASRISLELGPFGASSLSNASVNLSKFLAIMEVKDSSDCCLFKLVEVADERLLNATLFLAHFL